MENNFKSLLTVKIDQKKMDSSLKIQFVFLKLSLIFSLIKLREKFENFDKEMKQNEFDQMEFKFCKNMLKSKKIETTLIKKPNMQGISQKIKQDFKNDQLRRAEVFTKNR